jgi:hypothetical protein
MWAEDITYCNLCSRAARVILDSRADVTWVRGDGAMAPAFEKGTIVVVALRALQLRFYPLFLTL